MFKSTLLCGNPSQNCLTQLKFNEFHIFFHNPRQIFRELCSRAREEFHVCLVGCPTIIKTQPIFTLIRGPIPFGILVRFLGFQNFQIIFTIRQFMLKIRHIFSKMAIFGQKLICLINWLIIIFTDFSIEISKYQAFIKF